MKRVILCVTACFAGLAVWLSWPVATLHLDQLKSITIASSDSYGRYAQTEILSHLLKRGVRIGDSGPALAGTASCREFVLAPCTIDLDGLSARGYARTVFDAQAKAVEALKNKFR
jgi:hypothetical protein